ERAHRHTLDPTGLSHEVPYDPTPRIRLDLPAHSKAARAELIAFEEARRFAVHLPKAALTLMPLPLLHVGGSEAEVHRPDSSDLDLGIRDLAANEAELSDSALERVGRVDAATCAGVHQCFHEWACLSVVLCEQVRCADDATVVGLLFALHIFVRTFDHV